MTPIDKVINFPLNHDIDLYTRYIRETEDGGQRSYVDFIKEEYNMNDVEPVLHENAVWIGVTSQNDASLSLFLLRYMPEGSTVAKEDGTTDDQPL